MDYFKIFNDLETDFKKFLINQDFLSSVNSEIFYEKAFTTNINFRSEIISNGFRSEQEEINFFKFVKPKLLGLIKVMEKILSNEIKICNLNDSLMNQVLLEEIKKTNTYFTKKLCVLNYLSKDLAYDRYHFTRVKSKLSCSKKANEYGYYATHDDKLAKFWYKVYWVKYLSNRKEALNKDVSGINKISNGDKLKWTSSKSDFVELIYALVASGAINNGNVSFTKMYNHMLSFISVDSDINIHQVINDVKKRKKDVTKFIDQLNVSLLNYINQ